VTCEQAKEIGDKSVEQGTHAEIAALVAHYQACRACGGDALAHANEMAKKPPAFMAGIVDRTREFFEKASTDPEGTL
jgi:hypothetical protein